MATAGSVGAIETPRTVKGGGNTLAISAAEDGTAALTRHAPVVPTVRTAAGRAARVTIDGGWVVLGVWGAGVVVVLVPMGLGMMWLRRLRRKGAEAAAGEGRDLLERLCVAAGVKRKVGLWRSARCAVPLTYGVWRPVIVVPMEAVGWAEERRRMALLHELAHIRRGDSLTQMVMRCVRALYWFHPLAWVAAARAQAECERACDDRVLTAGTKSSAYATALMEYAAPVRQGGRVPMGALAMARPSTLEGRLRAILDGGRNRRG